jgi:hypothetical protein
MVRIRCNNAKVNNIGALETIFLLVPVPSTAVLCLAGNRSRNRKSISCDRGAGGPVTAPYSYSPFFVAGNVVHPQATSHVPEPRLAASSTRLDSRCDLSIATTRRWMEPLSPPSHDGTLGDAAAVASKLGLDTATSPRSATSSSPATSPPYWVHGHQRSFSSISVESVIPGAITLEDNDNAVDVKNKACWAKSVYIEDYLVVNENRTGIGAFVVWNITVETLRVS